MKIKVNNIKSNNKEEKEEKMRKITNNKSSSYFKDRIIIILFIILLFGTFVFIFLTLQKDLIEDKDYFKLRTHSIEIIKPFIYQNNLQNQILDSSNEIHSNLRSNNNYNNNEKNSKNNNNKNNKNKNRKVINKVPDWSLNHLTPIQVSYDKENPKFTLCKLNFKTYSESPHTYPMFKDVVQLSSCQNDIKKSYNEIMSEVNLLHGTPEGNIVYPTGFVFHESRVGSTLVANMFASNPFAMVFSESAPAYDALMKCFGCSEEEHINYFKKVVTIMGRSPIHNMLFFKFQSTTTTSISIALKAFPDVPWIFLYRHPVQTIVSHLLPRGAKGKITNMAPCTRSFHHESPALAKILDTYVPEGVKTNEPEAWCASHLTMLCESAMSAYHSYSTYHQVNRKLSMSQRGALINYDSLPGIIPKTVFPLFNIDINQEWLNKMIDESSKYSKERTLTKGEFTGDSEDKDERATPSINHWADIILQPAYDKMENYAKESVENIIQSTIYENENKNENIQNIKRLLTSTNHDITYGENSLIDWTVWKEIPNIRIDNEVNELEQESILLEKIESINKKKILPIMNYRDSQEINENELNTGDISNTLISETGRIEVGIHAQGVNSLRFEEINCPDFPESDYPKTYDMKDVIDNWNPDDTSVPSFHYNSICYFDFKTESHKILNYRNAEVPYIVYNVPEVDEVVKRWSSYEYIEKLLGINSYYETEISEYHNHFLYYHKISSSSMHKFQNWYHNDTWIPPTKSIDMTFPNWYKISKEESSKSFLDRKFYYFRVSSNKEKHFLYSELPFYDKNNDISKYFLINKKETRDIHCRFGMKGIVAEAHYDGHLNMAGTFNGLRRWILAHPNQCSNLYLYPSHHPSGRHSEVDWSKPDYKKYSKFKTAQVNEIIIKAGQILYVPTAWFHYIVSLNTNYQCNIRSGQTQTFDEELRKCGFK